MFFMLGVTNPILAQVEPSATGNGGGTPDEGEMMTPPPVSGMPYANTASSEERSNYLSANVTGSVAYIDNVLPGSGATPISAINYFVYPGVAFDRSIPRQKEQFSYSPSFTFYQSTGSESVSALDSIDHNAAAGYQFRFSPEVAFGVNDVFTRTSDVFNSSYLFSSPVTGSGLTSPVSVIAPFEEQMTNVANAVLSYQFARNAMIGGGGSFITFDLPNSSDVVGLYNSTESAGNVFYSRRFSRSQYLGLTYQYAHIVANPTNGRDETQTNTLVPFYTFYFNQSFSFSFSAGIDHVDATAPQASAVISWTPTVTVSAGWQGRRGHLAGNFSRTTSAGQGLVGAYEAKSIQASGGWKFARTWTGELSSTYTDINSETPLISSLQGGNTLTVSASVDHQITDNLSTRFQYQRLQESYNGIQAITPNSDRESITLTYQLRRPIGR
jgi:hypothetical protein